MHPRACRLQALLAKLAGCATTALLLVPQMAEMEMHVMCKTSISDASQREAVNGAELDEVPPAERPHCLPPGACPFPYFPSLFWGMLGKGLSGYEIQETPPQVLLLNIIRWGEPKKHSALVSDQEVPLGVSMGGRSEPLIRLTRCGQGLAISMLSCVVLPSLLPSASFPHIGCGHSLPWLVR